MTYKVINISPLPTRTKKLAVVDHSPMLPSLSEGCPSTDQLPQFSLNGDSSAAKYPTDMDDLKEINPCSSPIDKFEEYTTGGGGFPQVWVVVSLVSLHLPVVHLCIKSAPTMHKPTCCLVCASLCE